MRPATLAIYLCASIAQFADVRCQSIVISQLRRLWNRFQDLDGSEMMLVPSLDLMPLSRVSRRRFDRRFGCANGSELFFESLQLRRDLINRLNRFEPRFDGGQIIS